MPLQPIQPSAGVRAEQTAAQIVSQIDNLAKLVIKLRTEGIAAVAPIAPQTLPDGRITPARPGLPEVTPSAFESALGTTNCQVFDSIAAILGFSNP